MSASLPEIIEVLLYARQYYRAYRDRNSWIRRVTHSFELLSPGCTRESFRYDVDLSLAGTFLLPHEKFDEDGKWLPLSVIPRRSLLSMSTDSSFVGKPIIATREENSKILLFVILGWVSFQGYSLKDLTEEAIIDLYSYLLDPAEYRLDLEEPSTYSHAPGSASSSHGPRSIEDLRRINGFKKIVESFRDNYLLAVLVNHDENALLGEIDISFEYNVLPNSKSRLCRRQPGLRDFGHAISCFYTKVRSLTPLPMEWEIDVAPPVSAFGESVVHEHVRIIPPSAARILACSIDSYWDESPDNESKGGLQSAQRVIGNKRLFSSQNEKTVELNKLSKKEDGLDSRYNLNSSGASSHSRESKEVFEIKLPAAKKSDVDRGVVISESLLLLVRPHVMWRYMPLRPVKVALEMVTKRRLFLAPAFFASLFSLIITFVLIVAPELYPDYVKQELSAGVPSSNARLEILVAIVPTMVAALVYFKLEDELMTVNLGFSRIAYTVSSFLLLFYVSAESQLRVPSWAAEFLFLLQTGVFMHFAAQLAYISVYSRTVSVGMRRLAHFLIVAISLAVFLLLVDWLIQGGIVYPALKCAESFFVEAFEAMVAVCSSIVDAVCSLVYRVV